MNKHPDDYVFGMDVDLQNKLKEKFDPQKQAEAQAWVEQVTGAPFPEGKSFHESLKDGQILCKLVNIIQAGTVPKIYEGDMAFKQRENIVNYLEGCKKLGMNESDCFVTQDLFEGDNMIVVVDQIFALGGVAQKIEGFTGPVLGKSYAQKNVREFSAEVIAEGKTFVPATSAGSIAVEKEKGTDAIVMYGKAGQEMGKASAEPTQQTAGSIAVEKEKGTDSIVMYGKAGTELGKASSEVTQQNAGSIAVEKDKGTDAIVKYGKVGQELGKASSEPTQQNSGSIDTGRIQKIDMVTRGMN